MLFSVLSMGETLNATHQLGSAELKVTGKRTPSLAGSSAKSQTRRSEQSTKPLATTILVKPQFVPLLGLFRSLLIPLPQYKLIDDSTKVRDIFMLKTPTDASRDLAYLFDLQLSVLNTIWLEDEQAEVDNGEVSISPSIFFIG